ncbi:MAG: ABC transporter substrate-binding protein, partial [Rhodoglobus sp.]
ACASPEPAPTPTPTATLAPSGDGVLRIGTLIPTSGVFTFLGAAQTAGVDTAIKEINDAGGVNGALVEVVHRNSGDATTTKVEESMADLITQRADVVIGPSSSALAERIIPIAAAQAITVISPAATLPGLADVSGSQFFFRTVPSYARQGVALARAISQAGPQTVGIVYINDDSGKALVPVLTDALGAEGSAIVASVTVPAAEKDYTGIIDEVKKADPNVVVLVTSYTALDVTKALITKLVAAGLGGTKLWLTTQNTGDYSQALPAGLIKGVNGIIEGFEPDAAFIERLKQSDSKLTQFRYAAESYDATILAALAAIVGRDDGGASVAASLVDVSRGGIKCTSFGECLDVLKTGNDIDYDGISGPLNFTAEHDVAPAFYGLFSFNAENKFVFARGIVAG